MEARSVWLPKRGNSVNEYEDAGACNPERGRFAIADGATESSFAGSWARLLVDGFVAASDPNPQSAGLDCWTDWLPPLQQRWLDEVSNKELPWYAETKLQDGAFATFLGLRIGEAARGDWHAVAVGDGCLFQVRAEELRRAFPIEHAEEFGNAPWLIGSRDNSPVSLLQKEVRANGDWCAGDRFWLMTDALAQWFLADVEAGRKPWTKLEAVLAGDDSLARFVDWVEDQRDRHALKNDDVTLIRVCV